MLEDKICEVLQQQFKCRKDCVATFRKGYMVDYCFAVKRIVRLTAMKAKEVAKELTAYLDEQDEARLRGGS